MPGAFSLQKENPADTVQDCEQRIATTPSPPRASSSPESVSVFDGAATSAQSNAKRKSDSKSAAQTRRKMKLELCVRELVGMIRAGRQISQSSYAHTCARMNFWMPNNVDSKRYQIPRQRRHAQEHSNHRRTGVQLVKW